MASSLKSLTGVGADARKLAKLLQAKAPEGHMLAYINPREAALLKAHGGSGKPHADTGIPSFEDDVGDIEDYQAAASGGDFAAGGDVAPITPDTAGTTGQLGYDTGSYGFQPRATSAGQGLTAPESFIRPEISAPASPTYGVDTGRALSAGVGAQTPEEKSLIAQAAKATGLKEDTLAKLGIAGIQGLLGARQASRAEKAGQAGAQQIQALATPYQQKGQALQAQAQRGELTPQAMQSLQAAQAQVAQGVQNRGGVGAAQAQMQIEQLRQQLLQQQYDYGLKLSGIGDNIALGAIKTGMQADQYANQLTSSYFNNIARTIFGQGGQTPPPNE